MIVMLPKYYRISLFLGLPSLMDFESKNKVEKTV